MKRLSKLLSLAVSATCILSSVSFAASAVNYTVQKNNRWYYSDETSFRYSDFGANANGYLSDGSQIDFAGNSPESMYVSGKTDYNVSYRKGSSTASLSLKIGLCGDANMDGKIDVRDASYIGRCAAGTAAYPTDFNTFLADSDRDGTVTIRDASFLSKYLAEQSGCSVARDKEEKNTKINRVLELVNAERQKAGVNSLKLDSSLCRIADKRATETAVLFSHTRPDGTAWSKLLTDENIAFRYAGENIAAGYTTPEAVVEGWMNSEGHRKNILDPDFTNIGIGYYYDADSEYGSYWVQSFIQAK